MEQISRLKRASYPSNLKKMIKRISDSETASLEKIESAPEVNGVKWDITKLLQEWEIKKRDHLNAKDCLFFFKSII